MHRIDTQYVGCSETLGSFNAQQTQRLEMKLGNQLQRQVGVADDPGREGWEDVVPIGSLTVDKQDVFHVQEFCTDQLRHVK